MKITISRKQSLIFFSLLALSWTSAAAGRKDDSPGVLPPDQIDTVRVTRRDFSRSVTGYGYVRSRRRDDVPAVAGGVIQGIRARNGAKVTRGEKILRLRGEAPPPEMAALRARLKQSEIALEERKREYERIKKLGKSGGTYNKEEDQAGAAYQAALAEARAARETYDYYNGGATITAPADGYVVSLNRSPGNLVKAGDLLFSIVDLRNLKAEVEILNGDGPAIKPGDKATISAGGGRFPGKVTSVSPRVDPRTGKIRVNVGIELKRPGSLLPGEFVRAGIITGRHLSSLSLPRRALLNERGETVVMVKDGDTYEKRAVVTGFYSRDRVEILKGVREGEEVVTRGAYELLNRGIARKIKVED